MQQRGRSAVQNKQENLIVLRIFVIYFESVSFLFLFFLGQQVINPDLQRDRSAAESAVIQTQLLQSMVKLI